MKIRTGEIKRMEDKIKELYRSKTIADEKLNTIQHETTI